MDIYKFHIDLYRRDTRHLSAFEDGVYRRLIDEYMADECPLPDNDKALSSIARITLEEWQPIAMTMRAFFTLKNGRLIHKRCEIVLAEWRRYSKHQSEKAKKRHADHDKIINELPATAEPRHSQASAEPLPSVKSEEKEKKVSKEEVARAQESRASTRGTRIDPNWTPSEAGLAFAKSHHLSDEDINHEAARFRDYWVACAGAKGLKLDWDATWRVWVSRDRRNGNGQQQHRSHGPRRRSDVEIFAEVAARRSLEKGEH